MTESFAFKANSTAHSSYQAHHDNNPFSCITHAAALSDLLRAHLAFPLFDNTRDEARRGLCGWRQN